MNIKVFDTRRTMAKAAAAHAAAAIQRAIGASDRARILAATGASQFEFLEELTAHGGVEWDKVQLFHLDEYVGLPIDHPASFRKYLLERLISKTGIQDYLLLDGEGNPEATCRLAGKAVRERPIDVGFVGIGENGHLAFNDPPADFAATDPYIVVRLDEACRRQQVGEGWFRSVAEVPDSAISMSIRQILEVREIICVVPDARKAVPVKAAIEGPVSPMVPASILQDHPNVTIYLDSDSASLLQDRHREGWRRA